jgi:hypothetical protein
LYLLHRAKKETPNCPTCRTHITKKSKLLEVFPSISDELERQISNQRKERAELLLKIKVLEAGAKKKDALTQQLTQELMKEKTAVLMSNSQLVLKALPKLASKDKPAPKSKKILLQQKLTATKRGTSTSKKRKENSLRSRSNSSGSGSSSTSSTGTGSRSRSNRVIKRPKHLQE